MEDKKYTHFIEVWSGWSNIVYNSPCHEIKNLRLILSITEKYMFCETVAIWKIKLK